MAELRSHQGSIAVMPEENVDTDRIIPARFLSQVSRSGYGELLFKDVRGPEFFLDLPAADGASVLVVGSNFGCGSSREHAVWAIQQAGFRVVIGRRSTKAPGFSDIFRQNAANCGLLLIDLEEADHAAIASAGTGTHLQINLELQEVKFGDATASFDIDPALKKQHLEGRDLIGTTLVHAPEIEAFERDRLDFVPAKQG